ncbi:PIN domain-containing protein [Dyadobacter sp. MSC1_007]|uniref:PIN domain-containing protein n=1 Tax=Dyadobacter sp. MSC1_007 TaxID=2909264 RepID=UPI0038D3F6B1
MLAANVVDLLNFAPNSILTTPHYRWNLIADQDDNKFVDCAISCQADYVITHDRHFNVLAEIQFPKVKTLKMFELKGILGL